MSKKGKFIKASRVGLKMANGKYVYFKIIDTKDKQNVKRKIMDVEWLGGINTLIIYLK